MQQDGIISSYISSITGSDPATSLREGKAPYAKDIPTASALAKSAQTTTKSIPNGKAAAQAAGSREQVLSDPYNGGAHILAEEALEERIETLKVPVVSEPAPLRRSPRKKTLTSTPVAQAGSLKGLRDRVSSTGTGFHGRTGAVLGYESSR